MAFSCFFLPSKDRKVRKITYFTKKSPIGFDITHIWLTFAFSVYYYCAQQRNSYIWHQTTL